MVNTDQGGFDSKAVVHEPGCINHQAWEKVMQQLQARFLRTTGQL